MNSQELKALLREYIELDKIRTSGIYDSASLAAARYRELTREYRDSLPVLPLSRCPFCHQVNTFAIETGGLHGLWWTIDQFRRPPLKQFNLCPHFFNLLGAVKLHYPVEVSPFLVRPGPEVPFVVPDLTKQPTVKAVISSLNIGSNLAYPIFYYTEVQPTFTFKDLYGDRYYSTHFYQAKEPVSMPPMWGSNYYCWREENGREGICESTLSDEDCDFNLAPWIEADKLLWITPGDESLTLHNTLDDCPYLNLSGHRETLRIENGAVRYSRDRETWYSEDGESWLASADYYASSNLRARLQS